MKLSDYGYYVRVMLHFIKSGSTGSALSAETYARYSQARNRRMAWSRRVVLEYGGMPDNKRPKHFGKAEKDLEFDAKVHPAILLAMMEVANDSNEKAKAG